MESICCCRHQRFCQEKIMIPSDICSLVQKTYCEIDENQRFQPAYEEYKKECMLRKQNAKPYCLEKPEIGKYGGTLVGLLDKSVGLDDVKAQAAVRDGNPSIEVIVVRETESGFVSIIAGKLKGKNIISGKQYQLTKPEKYQSKNSAFLKD